MLLQSVKGAKTKLLDVVDGLIIRYFCIPVAPWFKATGHTANIISVYGGILTLAYVWYLWRDDMLRFSLYFWLAYLFDCLDGFYARKYNMVTPEGDLFEHMRDIMSLLLTMAICAYSYVLTQPVLVLVAISSGLAGIHVGCVQRSFVDRDYSESLDVLQNLCLMPAFSHIANNFGIGMYMTTLYFLILYLSGGFFLFFKMFMISTVVLYFVGLYHKKTRRNRRRVSEAEPEPEPTIVRLPTHFLEK